MSLTMWGVLLALLAALANLLGGLIILSKRHWNQRFLHDILSVGAGFMLAAAILEMIPHSIEGDNSLHVAPLLILVGYLLIQLSEHTFAHHFHFGEETHHDVHHGSNVGMAALFGLMVHTFFDGIAIGSSMSINARLGVLVFLAVVLHKIPEGFTMASIMIASGRGRRMAFIATALIAAATLAGALLALLGPQWDALARSIGITGEHIARYALALSAGVTIYVAASDLIPEVNAAHGVRSSILVFVGVAVFYAAELLLRLAGVEH